MANSLMIFIGSQLRVWGVIRPSFFYFSVVPSSSEQVVLGLYLLVRNIAPREGKTKKVTRVSLLHSSSKSLFSRPEFAPVLQVSLTLNTREGEPTIRGQE